MAEQGARDSNSYGAQRPGDFGKKMKTSQKTRITNEDVSAKISKLRHEGKRQDVAVATALDMKRRGRLTKGGGYRHVKK